MIIEGSISKSGKGILQGKITLNYELLVQSTNEGFYRYLGTNARYPLDNLMHPDDAKEFLSVIKALKPDAETNIVSRIKNLRGEYEAFLLRISLAKTQLCSGLTYSIRYTNLIYISERGPYLETQVKKYRRLLAFERNSFFEYNIENEEIVVYMYVNDRALTLVRTDIKSWYYEALESKRIMQGDLADFENMYASIRNGMSDFIYHFENNVFVESEREEKVTVKGSMIFMDEARKFVVGTITSDVYSSDSLKTSYYLSEMSRDSSTGLFNKKAIAEYVTEKIVDKGNFYFVVMDIDDFKYVNDTYGHMFGDVVLQRMAEILKSVVNVKGICGRFGGDEFVLVLENMDEESLRLTLKTIYKNLTVSFANEEYKLNVTLSMGISKFPDNGDTYDKIFMIADRCLYIAKQKGKARFIIYDEEKHGSFENKEAITSNANQVQKEVKNKTASELVNDLCVNGKTRITHALDRIRKDFGVDAISVYAGEKLRRVYMAGEYSNDVLSFEYLLNEKYISILTKDEVTNFNSINSIEVFAPAAYNEFVKAGVEQSLQCVYVENGSIKALITLDIFEKKAKREENDVVVLGILGKLVCRLAAE